MVPGWQAPRQEMQLPHQGVSRLWGVGAGISHQGGKETLGAHSPPSSQEMSGLGQGRVSLHPSGFPPERLAGGDLLVKSCCSLNDTEAPHLRLGPPRPPRPLSVLGHFIEADTTGGTQTPRPTSHRGTAGALEIRPLTVLSALEAETGREWLCPGLSTRHPALPGAFTGAGDTCGRWSGHSWSKNYLYWNRQWPLGTRDQLRIACVTIGHFVLGSLFR